MALINKYIAFDDAILDFHPDLKEFLKPNDQYPELEHILKNSSANLPDGSLNTKVIINDGVIVERVFETPKGEVFSILSTPSNDLFDQVA